MPKGPSQDAEAQLQDYKGRNSGTCPGSRRTDEAAGAYLRGQDYYRKIESAGADNGEKGGR